MSRSYNARITALITGVQLTWLDNLLSRHNLPGVSRSRQGIDRRISEEGMLAVELCRILNLELGISLTHAVEIATQCLNSATDDELRLPRVVDGIMDGAMRIDEALIRAGVSLPAGGSLLVVGEKIVQ